jgi:large subunit ribosomal protein L7/L12
LELTYILIAAAIVVLPFVLTKLLSGKSGDTTKVLGAYTPPQKPAPKPKPKPAAAAPADYGLLTDQIKALLARGNKLEAIKLTRSRTGFPLEAAKDMVETIEKTGGAATAQAHAPATVDPIALIRNAKDLSQDALQLVKQGKKIDAIQLIRGRTGLGLKEAKEIVDRLG